MSVLLEELTECLHQLHLGTGVHALTDDLGHTVTGALPQRSHAQESQDDRHEALVGDKADVDPGHILADNVQTVANDCRAATLVLRLLASNSTQWGTAEHYSLRI